MKVKIEIEDGGLVVGVPLQDVSEFENFMDDTGVLYKDEGDDDTYLWYEVDLDGLPFLNKWNDTH